MVDTFLESAKKERARLRAELEANPVFLRLKWVEEFIASNEKTAQPRPAAPKQANGVNGFATKKASIEGYALECIRLKDNKATMQDIHDFLESKGIKVKQNTLSAYLSMGKKTMGTTYNVQTKEWSVA